ncbi:MAG: carbohydrate-binding domain-containing protein [Spirochaetales bacterium]|nr:carbohydrate-binding domain-containing protein [Spirochaetales bacterium]
MNKKLIFCVVLSLLIVLSGCASKSAETEEANVEIEAKATFDAMPEGMEPPKGMTPPEGMMPREGMTPPEGMNGMMAFGDRNMGSNGYLSLTDDVSFSSTLDYEEYIGESNFEINEEEYQNYPILLGTDGLVGTTMMYTKLVVEVDGTNLKITNTSSEKYNIILSGSWNGGITIESDESDIMVTLAESRITGINTPALILKGGNTTYIKSMGSSVISDTGDNKKKGALTSDGNVVFFGDGEITVNGEKKHGFKVDGVVEIEGGTVRINIAETAEGNGISADDAFLMNGGYLYIFAKGNVYGEESKGIKVNGRESDNPMGWVEINGGYIEIESVGKGITAGFEADENGETEDTSDDPDPILTINGGVVKIRSTGTPYEISDEESLSPEGLEAKDKLFINGGIVEVSATDDAINAGSSIEINGGYVFAVSRGDDGIDSNGTIVFNGGTAVIIGAGGMGLGIDCDSDNNIKYNGGTLIGIGGGNNAPVSGNMISFSFDMSGSSFVLQSEEGDVIAAYTLPSSKTQNNVVVMSEKLEKGKTYNVVVDAGIESDGVFNGLSLGDTSVSGGTVTYSEVASSIASGYHYSMGRGMNGGGMPFNGGERPERPFRNN